MIKKIIKSFLFIIPIIIFSGRLSAQSPCSCWVTPDSTWSVVPFSGYSPPLYRNDDGYTSAIPLAFNYCFWGTTETSVYINNNGNISFGAPYSTYTAQTFPLSGFSMLAPFWADVDTRNIASGVVYYKLTPTYLIVQWDTVGYFGMHADKKNSFQCIMSNGSDPIIPYGNNTEFCYKTMQWTTGDASLGVNGFDNSLPADAHPATVGANKGDAVNFIQFGLFGVPGSTYLGQYPPFPYDGISWLDNQDFIFSTCSNSAPPSVSGVSPCDTFQVCMGDTTDLHIFFYSPKSTDSTFSALTPPVLSGVSILNNWPGNTDSLIIQVIGDSANYGTHTVNLYGYDNESPPDTNFVSFVLEVDSVPSGTLTASIDTICAGDSVKLKAISGSTPFLWSTGQTIDSVEEHPDTTTVYNVHIGNGLCALVLSQRIVVLTSPSISITKDSLCQGDSTTLTAYNANSFTWSNGATTSSITVTPDSTMTYKVYTVNACLGNDTLSELVHVFSPPAITLGGPDSICVGNSATLTVSGIGTYQWSNGSTQSSITVSPASTTTYTVSVTNICTKDTTRTLTVDPIPTGAITYSPNDTVCPGDSTMLIASGGGTYVWTNSGKTSDTIWVKPASTTTYNLQVTKYGCVGAASQVVYVRTVVPPSLAIVKDTICPYDSTTMTASGGTSYQWLSPLSGSNATVTVKSDTTITYSVVVTNVCFTDTLSKTLHIAPVPKISFSGDTVICRGQVASITASGGSSYSWSNGNINSTLNVNPTSTTTYTVTVSNGTCSSDSTVTVVVDTPNIKISPNENICIGNSITLSASGGGTYLWSNGDTTSTITVSPNSDTSYSVKVTNGCVDSGTITVNVDNPSLYACCNDTIILGSSDTLQSSGQNNVTWAPSGSLNCATCPDPIASPTVTTTYTVSATDSGNCTIARTVTIVVEVPCADFNVPNVFTPNNDGINDDFVVKVLNASSYSIVIYDRWGKKVYSSNDVTQYWNGKYNGKDYLVPDGVYYYIIKATCVNNNYIKKGFVQVMGEK